MKRIIIFLLVFFSLFSYTGCNATDNVSYQEQESITNDEPDYSKYTDAIPWHRALDHVGETITLVGDVCNVYYAQDSDGKPTFINIGEDYPDKTRLTVVVWGDDLYQFDGDLEDLYLGQSVFVTGIVETYDGVAQIVVSSPSQIEIEDFLK